MSDDEFIADEDDGAGAEKQKQKINEEIEYDENGEN